MFVFIHPDMDGNGRLGRFIMNTMLTSGGFPWTVLRLEDRDRYMDPLNAASGKSDVKPFAAFVAQSLAAAKNMQAEPPFDAALDTSIEEVRSAEPAQLRLFLC
ncbi:hypothetical protein AB4Z46_18950 [Variovorax sp. M-6]|uniref:hypothetical protein n=1 Tax=Variovorax sp. M-6 TaxID=3233041 RepID=UPI003F9B6902